MTDVPIDPDPLLPPPPADTTITVDLDALSLRDIRKIEVALKRKLGDMFGNGMAGVDAEGLAGVIWVMQSKTDPTFTIEDALDTRFKDISQASDAEVDPETGDPTQPTPPTL